MVRTVLRGSVAVLMLALLVGCHSSSDDGATNAPPVIPPPSPPPGTPVAGLDQRPANLTCVAPAKTNGNAGTTIRLERVFANLTFNQPLAMLQAPGDNSRWFVLEKTGAVRVFNNVANPTASTFISLTVNSNSEGGLLGMAFHPSYATNGRVYLSWTEGTPMVSTIARFTPYARRGDVARGQPAERHSREPTIRESQRRANRTSGRTATFTVALATAGPAATLTAARKIRPTCSAISCGST